MSSITTCPNCQTQFAVTKTQLNQYNGKVRCGHCLHVFDATAQLQEAIDEAPIKPKKKSSKTAKSVSLENIAATEKVEAVSDESAWPTIALLDEDEQPENIIKSAEIIIAKTKGTEFEADEDEDFAIETIDYATINHDYGNNDPFIIDTSKLPLESTQAIGNKNPRDSSTTINIKTSAKKSFSWLTWLFVLLFLLAAIGQSLYFLREQIAAYYPSAKPMLEQACVQIGCSINLPKQIDFIIIDDSEMHEDTERKGLIRLDSTLINQAGFAQAYPNLELTLTDADDKPKLRRTFKPEEYLPTNTDISNGLPAGAEIKINLAISAAGETVSGYRLFVTY